MHYSINSIDWLSTLGTKLNLGKDVASANTEIYIYIYIYTPVFQIYIFSGVGQILTITTNFPRIFAFCFYLLV